FALDVALADVLAQVDQILFLTALVHHEEDIDLVERIDRLHRDVIGIAGTDTDDENLSHLQTSSAIQNGQQVQERYCNQAWTQHRGGSRGNPARPRSSTRPMMARSGPACLVSPAGSDAHLNVTPYEEMNFEALTKIGQAFSITGVQVRRSR